MLERSSGSRYAKALFSLSRELKIDAEVEAALEELSRSLKSSPETERLLMNPRLGVTEKRRIFSRVLSGSTGPTVELLLNFISVLFEKNRFGLIHDIAVSFKTISDEAQGESVAVVRTAQALDPANELKLLSVLEKRTGTKIVIQKHVDPSILGGVEVRIGNRVIDGTVRGGIARIKEKLLRRN
jgi:F-type H+-transporting ATPase subunit delta